MSNGILVDWHLVCDTCNVEQLFRSGSGEYGNGVAYPLALPAGWLVRRDQLAGDSHTCPECQILELECKDQSLEQEIGVLMLAFGESASTIQISAPTPTPDSSAETWMIVLPGAPSIVVCEGPTLELAWWAAIAKHKGKGKPEPRVQE